ncbi:anthranilate phosphoribosyltransferase [Halobacillus karajensis]|uniref:Anthranilate phosphoribosyltransferase n=1 Tax=Halobacillus karajensis TaxID=195088 RepID=A0A024P4Z9_9BACI|nr:anthranilate phosphoribosyltransferase [Halobacillus karajensis]CDQ20417.1 Anthranilate phosphoribosyltransferase [Halobacillus karajensis]CDQ24114.1 Anthranilate phosphoribosyltransferase [Halobacillus karajensis]CDQ27592.1 Anthranilate phosphoribosyltransferase [Halobacillus karajensis]SEH91973.1 anthranilate phosphoribosyltransferase [Halobacillus karajensis]
MKDLLSRVVAGDKLTEKEAFDTMDQIMNGKATTGQMMSMLSVMRYRGETVEEMTGFVRAMRSNMTKMDVDDPTIVDTCGTGGDGASTFNISTAVSIVLASMRVKVAKHGNRKVSSRSGSADVLETLGVPIDTTPEQGARALAEKGMTFMFAPLYHKAMKHAGPARQELGFRTIFNLLGPMSNPANAKRQLIGIYDTNFAENMAETLKKLGSTHVLLATGRDGLDEITVTGRTDVVELKDGQISRFTVSPKDFGLPLGNLEDIRITKTEESAQMIKDVLYGSANQSAASIVTLNAAAGLYVAGKADDLHEGVKLVQDAINNGVTREYFEAIISERENRQYA